MNERSSPSVSACAVIALRRGQPGELVLGGEVAVEAAVGEAGGAHQLADVDAVDAALAEELGGALDDLLPVLGGVLFRRSWH